MSEPSGVEVGSMIDPEIFKQVQDEIDEDVKVRDEIRGLLKSLDKQERSIQSVLSRVHAVPTTAVVSLLASAEPFFHQQRETLIELDCVASKYPYYKYNGLWTREIQAASYGIVLAGWLGAFTSGAEERKEGRLMTISEVGEKLGVRVNVKESDVFHLTLEEYLHSLITMIEELTRLAVNSVTLGDYQRPMLISRFVKDLHAGFQLLNLKNDSLRRRSDSIKYNSTFLSLLLALAVGTPTAFVVMVLLGAPITTHILRTALSAAHLSLLTGFPLVYSYQVQGSKWRDIISVRLPIDEVYGGALGACIGTWFGAIPIPLDWDREWQKWPITIIVGMYVGYVFGRVGGFGLAGTVARIDQ
ncbi:Translin-1 [Arthrobotrys entomopaga]|nr:Translin-1 [Arthrobotrys entomopaga]